MREFWVFFQRHCAIPSVKVHKGTTKIGETSSLIRHMYIFICIVIITNRYIVMHTSRGIVQVVLHSSYRNTHTTRNSYNTFIQRANTIRKSKVEQKIKLAFIEVINRGTYIRIWLGFSLYFLTKTIREKGRGKR